MNPILGISVVPGEGKEHARKTTLYCTLPDEHTCPYWKIGQCIHASSFRSCPYGRRNRETGYTKRARGHNAQVKQWREEQTQCGHWPASPKHEHIAVIGEYVWLGAYPHIDHRDNTEGLPFYMTDDKPGKYSHVKQTYPALRGIKVPVLAPSGAFMAGQPWIKVEDFTPQVAAVLALSRPQALMGGEIKVYQQEQVPRFLFHLKTYMPEIWAGVLELVPALEKRLPSLADIRSKTVNVWKLPAQCAIEYPYTRKRLPANIAAQWDGQKITLMSNGAGPMRPLFLWRKVPDDAVFELSFVPPPGFQVLVLDDEVLAQLWEAGEIQV